MLPDAERREQAIADLVAAHPGIEELLRSPLADEDRAEARRGGYEDTWLVATGRVSMEKLQRSIATLLDVLADDHCWLLAGDPLAWRYTMTDMLWQQVDRFVANEEGPLFDVVP